MSSKDIHGVLHGPFVHDIHMGDRFSTERVLAAVNDTQQLKQMFVTNTQMLRQVENLLDCVKLLKIKPLKSFLQFDVDSFLNSPKKRISDQGWWCRDMSTIYRLCVSGDWIKERVVLKDTPVRELLDCVTVCNDSVQLLNNSTDNCMMFIDQTTDDVVDDHMLWCISTCTPMLIRRNATAEEYLGSDYVLMFDDIHTAHELLTDDNIRLAHEQLKRI